MCVLKEIISTHNFYRRLLSFSLDLLIILNSRQEIADVRLLLDHQLLQLKQEIRLSCSNLTKVQIFLLILTWFWLGCFTLVNLFIFAFWLVPVHLAFNDAEVFKDLD